MKLTESGADVALFSSVGTAAWICLFDGDKETKRLALGKTGDVFAASVPDIKAGDHYGFRVDGPWSPAQGYLFDKQKLLVDPFATRLSKAFAYDPALSKFGVDTAALVPKGIVMAQTPNIPPRQVKKPEFIYELGIKSFTMLHPDVPPQKRGTVAALAEPAVLQHLKALGVDTIEIMPIHAWIDERHLLPLGLHNAWGYNAIQFMAPDPRLCPGGWDDLRTATDALHAAGLQLIVDVVYNHTGESDLGGPTLSLRGLDNTTYYAQSNGRLHNDTGCGNTLSLNTPEVTHMVLHSMRHLVSACGVDGFRFDLATVLGRTDAGFANDAPLIKAIAADDILKSRILIAEPWDVGPGGYRLGNFPKGWLEWNDQYRDGVRRFWRGAPFSANQLATRLCGSSDIFGGRSPSASVNFVAAHDGFTLHDLVSYESKLNDANGEGNRDGNAAEVTWKGGNVRALLATLFLSRGTIMMTAGDEFGRTQKGNNNAYAQDNALIWLDWQNRDPALQAFVQGLSKFRRDFAVWFADEFPSSDEAAWFNIAGAPMDWQAGSASVLGLLLTRQEKRVALVFNASSATVAFPLPVGEGRSWQRRFCSATGEECPAHAVAVFEETLSAPVLVQRAAGPGKSPRQDR